MLQHDSQGREQSPQDAVTLMDGNDRRRADLDPRFDLSPQERHEMDTLRPRYFPSDCDDPMPDLVRSSNDPIPDSVNDFIVRAQGTLPRHGSFEHSPRFIPIAPRLSGQELANLSQQELRSHARCVLLE